MILTLNPTNKTDQKMKSVTNVIRVKVPAEKLWKVLTHSEHTKKYMFGCEVITDWKPGSAVIWRGQYEGASVDFVTGFVLEIQPDVKLKYSVIDPNAVYPKTPENHLNVTYLLNEVDGVTEFTVVQDGFENVADGEKRYTEVSNNGEGWNPILMEIRKIAEEI
jgi:uncharacterized protein YndB with AHSA1/START domain